MELVKDIYFNTDKLVENTNVKISYTGKFYQDQNDKVFIHYGYGENWSNINEVEMLKTDLGYQTELHLLTSNTLNFCFKNQNNEWDNNFGKNYIFNIEKSTTNDINEKINVLPFLGKTTENDKTEILNNSGITNTNEINNSNTIDTFISKKTQNNNQTTISPIGNNAENEKINSNIYTTFNTSNENIVSLNNSTINNNAQLNTNNTQNSEFKIVNKITPNTNAITVIPTSFQKVWAQKIKATFSSIWSYMPKFITGNYKRDIDIKK